MGLSLTAGLLDGPSWVLVRCVPASTRQWANRTKTSNKIYANYECFAKRINRSLVTLITYPFKLNFALFFFSLPKGKLVKKVLIWLALLGLSEFLFAFCYHIRVFVLEAYALVAKLR